MNEEVYVFLNSPNTRNRSRKKVITVSLKTVDIVEQLHEQAFED